MALPAEGLDSRQAWVVAFASLALIAVGLGNTMALVVLLKPIAADFGWPRAVPSLAYSLMLLGIGAGGMVMGPWSDRVGMGPPALVAALAIGGGLVLASVATSRWHFYIAFGLLGGLLGNAALFAPLVANTTRWFHRRRGMAVALVTTGQSIAGAVWPLVFRYVAETAGWRATFLWFGLFALAVMPPLVLVVRRRPPAASTAAAAAAAGGPGSVLGLPPARVTFFLFLAQVCCCVAMATPLVHVVAHVTDLGFPLARGAEVLSVMLATSFFSRFALGWLSDRIGGFRTLLSGSAIQACSLVLFLFVEGFPALYLVGFIFGLGFGGIVPSYAIIARAIFPLGGIGWRIAAIFLGGPLGMAAGGWMAGYLFDLTGGYGPAFMVGLVFNAANLAIVGALHRRRRSRPDDAAPVERLGARA